MSASIDVDDPVKFLKHIWCDGSMAFLCVIEQTAQYLFFTPIYSDLFVAAPKVTLATALVGKILMNVLEMGSARCRAKRAKHISSIRTKIIKKAINVRQNTIRVLNCNTVQCPGNG